MKSLFECKATIAFVLTCLPMTASAEGHEICPLLYATYEVSVPHTDLEECPVSLAVESAYCRVSIMSEVATIFAFSEDSDCLVASRSYYEDEFSLILE